MNKTEYTDKLKETLHIIPEEHQHIAEELIEELVFMREVLDNVKQELVNEGATSMFVNGAQSNTRQTPEFKSYMDLSNRYKQYLGELKNLYPKSENATDELTPEAQLLAEFMTSK